MNERIDIGTVNDCKNLSESYGEICVKCNKCGRFDQEKQIEEMAEVLENAKIEAHATIGSMNNGFGVWYAQALYNAGCRMQGEVVDANSAIPTSEVAKIFEEIDGFIEKKHRRNHKSV